MEGKIPKTTKNYNHFSFEERELLALELAKNKTQKEIATLLGRNPSTISREINRNGSYVRKNYLASHADKRSRERKLRSHAKDRLKEKRIRDYTTNKLKIGWTPEIIAGRISQELPGAKTNHESIYLFIYKDAPNLAKYLPRSGRKRQKRQEKTGKRSRIPNRISITERPEIINNRLRVGDWEADTMVSRQSSSILVVLRERVTQVTRILKLPNKTAIETKKAIIRILQEYPPELRLSITFDNGTENALHEEIASKLKLQTYFCQPYHSWEKGSIENTNGLIRRYLPKKTDFSLISDKEIQMIEQALNNRPRKSLNFRTPLEALKDCA